MSKAGIDAIRLYADDLRDMIRDRQRQASIARQNLAIAEAFLAGHLAELADCEADIAKLEMADRLTRIYGKDPRTEVL